MLFASDPYKTALMTFRDAARALDCTVHDIKAMVLAGKLFCVNYGHDKDRILMTSSRVPMHQVKRILISQILTSLDGAIATADERQVQRETEAAHQRSLAWKEEWERRHTGEAYYDPDGQWYVYTLSTPADRIFYVGKGCGTRVHQHEQEAKKGCECYKCRTICKVWRNGGEIKKAIVFRSRVEQAAYDYESTLIARIGLANLTNVMAGGGKAIRVGPKRKMGVINLHEHRYYLALRGAKVKKTMREWIQERIERLEVRAYNAWRYTFGREERIAKAEEIEEEILVLKMALGDIDQLTLF